MAGRYLFSSKIHSVVLFTGLLLYVCICYFFFSFLCSFLDSLSDWNWPGRTLYLIYLPFFFQYYLTHASRDPSPAPHDKASPRPCSISLDFPLFLSADPSQLGVSESAVHPVPPNSRLSKLPDSPNSSRLIFPYPQILKASKRTRLFKKGRDPPL